MDRLILISCVIVIVSCSVGHAVEPGSKADDAATRSEVTRTLDKGAPLPFPQQVIVGDVVGADGKPIGGVMVKLFADGLLVEVGHTTAAGSFELRLPLNVERDETVVLWFMSTTESLLPQCVLLKESSRAAKANLFSKCINEVRMRPQMRVDVTMMGESEVVASLKLKGCL
ncbi:MAG: hypothetical protein ABIJ00_07405 [Candidatus Eisenbacteria bacterium]